MPTALYWFSVSRIYTPRVMLVCRRCGTEFGISPSRAAECNIAYCSRVCRVGADTFEGRFWSKVQKSATCWIWTASKTEFGYGRISIPGRGVQKAHRIAWELSCGAIPSDLAVCHHCDTPACVRPDHLFLGTKADNTQDMMVKGRQRTNPVRGSAGTQARLNEAQVADIKRRRQAGETMSALGREYGVSKTAIRYIIIGRNWGHLNSSTG